MNCARLSFAFLIAAVASVTVAMSPAYAAVRECGEIVSSEIVTAPTELEAKKKAIEEWHAKALKLGVAAESWRLAYDKSLQCFPKGSVFECVAFGRPCVINQAPGKKLEPAPPKVGI
jgi:hypothetical protein